MADSIQVYKRTPERDRILTAVPRRSHVPTGNKVQNASTKRKAAEGGMWQCSVTRFPNAEATEEDKHNWYLDITWQGRESVLEGDMYKGVVGIFYADTSYTKRRKEFFAYYNYNGNKLIDRLRIDVSKIRIGLPVYYCILTSEFTIGSVPKDQYEDFFIHVAEIKGDLTVDESGNTNFVSRINQFLSSAKEVVYNYYSGPFSARIETLGTGYEDRFKINDKLGRMTIERGEGDIIIDIKPGKVYVNNEPLGSYGGRIFLSGAQKYIVLSIDKTSNTGTFIRFSTYDDLTRKLLDENCYFFGIVGMFDSYSWFNGDDNESPVLYQLVSGDIYIVGEKPPYDGEFALRVESTERDEEGKVTATNIVVTNGLYYNAKYAGRVLWGGVLVRKPPTYKAKINESSKNKYIWLRVGIGQDNINSEYYLKDTDEPTKQTEEEAKNEVFPYWWLIGYVNNGKAHQAHYYGPLVITDRLYDVTDKEEDDSK